VVDRYETALNDSLKGFVDDQGNIVRKGWKPGTVNHNLISPVIVIEYGRTRVVLGGDVERESWGDILDDMTNKWHGAPRLSCQFFKVSHHGSTNGYTQDLYERFVCEGRRPIAAITPYNRNRSPLPSLDGLTHIKARVSKLYVTNRSAVLPPRSAPDPWMAMIGARPELAGALHESLLSGSQKVAPLSDVPKEWLLDLIVHPEWHSALRPELRDGSDGESAPDLEDRFRLSFYFDDAGKLADRIYQGSGAGRLA